MQQWIENIPWWAKWAFMGGFGLMSAFGSTILPIGWQAFGFYLGIALIVFAAVGSTRHVSKSSFNLDLSYLIPVGLLGAVFFLCVAAVGYAWQRYFPPLLSASNDVPPQVASAASTTIQNLAKLPNEQLRERTSALVTRMRVFESGLMSSYVVIMNKYGDVHLPGFDPEKKRQHDVEWTTLSNRAQAEFDREMRPEALALREELRRRTGRFTPQERDFRNWGLDHNLAGPRPISDAADYLEELARALP